MNECVKSYMRAIEYFAGRMTSWLHFSNQTFPHPCLAYHAVIEADWKTMEVEDDDLLAEVKEPLDVLYQDVDWPHREEVVVNPERIAGNTLWSTVLLCTSAGFVSNNLLRLTCAGERGGGRFCPAVIFFVDTKLIARFLRA